MGLRDDAITFLRQVFGRERAERERAESPSAEAERNLPSSIFSVWGREDVGGLLTVSQNLMDKFADCEQMDEYPDINCLAGDTKVYIAEGSVIKPAAIHDLAAEGGGYQILAYDLETSKLVLVQGENPRLTANNIPVIAIKLSNGETIKCTKDHKFLKHGTGYVNAELLKKDDKIVSSWAGFSTSQLSIFSYPAAHYVTVVENPSDAGVTDVYDVTTKTHNFVANGVVVHNSANHYFTNDATQPDIDTGRTIWVHSNDHALKELAETLLHKRLKIEDEIWSIVYTTVKYGNDYEEVLVTENGVIGLNALPVPTMRRVEQANGSLIGYVQDITGKFTQDAADLRGMLAGQTKIPDHVALFEEWQVLHTRLRGTTRRSPYGVSISDGARWIWKRLVLLEDAMLIYKLCLRGDSQIWTPDGRKAIKDLNEGDEVYSYTTEDKLKKTKVVYKKHNGQDRIFKIRSKHRELFANATHPVLVEWTEHFGSGRAKVRHADYVEVKSLVPGKHSLFLPKKNAEDWEPVHLVKPELVRKARIKQSSVATGLTRKMPLPDIAKKLGVHAYRTEDFFAGNYDLVADTAVALLEANGYGSEHLDIKESWSGRTGTPVYGINVPDVVDADFSRWFGFMLGDGFITTRHHKDGYEACNEVGFALGDDQEMNSRYRTLFERYAGTNLKLVADNGGRLGSYAVYSSAFAEFMKLNGFIPGAAEKRLPDWIYKAHPSIKLALLEGLVDADGHRRPKGGRISIELCNKALLEDVRELAMQLGLIVCLVRERNRAGGHVVDQKTGRRMPPTTSYTLDFYFKQAPLSEPITSVEEVSNDDIWDIGVEADEHNFIANGVPVHNTRAPARFAFYIDVTDIPGDKVESFLRKAKQDLRKQKMVNPRTQRLDMRFNPMDNSEDFFIAVREGRELARVEVLQGPDYQATDDVDYFARKLHGVLKVPRSYLGQDDAVPGKSILSNEDVRAARVTMGVQREVRNSIRRLVQIDLAARGIDPFKHDLQVMMTVPSGIYELAHMEVKNARADFAGRIQPFVSKRYIQKVVFKMSDEEIDILEKEIKKEQEEQAAQQQQQQGGAPGGAASGPLQMPDTSGALTGAPGAAAPPPGSPDIGPPPGTAGRPNTAGEWKSFDNARRLEEKKEKLSEKRHDEIMDTLVKVVSTDRAFASRLNQTNAFLQEFRHTAFARNGNGSVVAAPRGRGHKK